MSSSRLRFGPVPLPGRRRSLARLPLHLPTRAAPLPGLSGPPLPGLRLGLVPLPGSRRSLSQLPWYCPAQLRRCVSSSRELCCPVRSLTWYDAPTRESPKPFPVTVAPSPLSRGAARIARPAPTRIRLGLVPLPGSRHSISQLPWYCPAQTLTLSGFVQGARVVPCGSDLTQCPYPGVAEAFPGYRGTVLLWYSAPTWD